MDALSPADAEVTLRSLTRRFRAAVAAAASDDETGDVLAERIGPDGNSVIDHLVATVGGLSVLDRALEQVLTADQPVLHAGVVDPTDRDFAAQVSRAPSSLEDHLLDLEITADRLADRIDRTPATRLDPRCADRRSYRLSPGDRPHPTSGQPSRSTRSMRCSGPSMPFGAGDRQLSTGVGTSCSSPVVTVDGKLPVVSSANKASSIPPRRPALSERSCASS